jgi:hypothetical protein
MGSRESQTGAYFCYRLVIDPCRSMGMNTPLNFQFDGKNAAKAFFSPRRLVAFEAEIHSKFRNAAGT